MNFKQFLALLGIFAFTVLIRWPNLDRPLSKHHEFVTAISLRVLQVWEQEGAGTFNWSPAMNYSGRANKFIDNHATSLHQVMDEHGNYYYTSHPPLAYILPHVFFTTFGLEANVLNLQLFHLLINLLTAFIVVWIVKALNGSWRQQLLSYTIYLFLPAVLWFQSNTYMSDMLVHFFFALGILVCIHLNNAMRKRTIVAYFLVIFAMIYTSWLGILFAAVSGTYFLFKVQRRSIFFVSLIASVGALALIYLQYSSINGSQAFLDQLSQRFSARGSNSSDASYSFFRQKGYEVGLIAFNYIVNYASLIVLFVVILFNRSTLKNVIQSNKMLFILSVIPVILLHLLLLNYSGHDFTVLYLSLFIALIAGKFLAEISSKQATLTLISIIVLGCANYYVLNLPGDTSIKGDRYDVHLNQANYILENSTEHVDLFWEGQEVNPMVIVYCKRNIKTVTSIVEAKIWLGNPGDRVGYYFSGDSLYTVEEINNLFDFGRRH
ncbi:MAG: hypothetical protein QNK23_13325 [Crocinitomicaceae bacterium]|nr:hypothetical protein [Crocinitomicaceae bacterium]